MAVHAESATDVLDAATEYLASEYDGVVAPAFMALVVRDAERDLHGQVVPEALGEILHRLAAFRLHELTPSALIDAVRDRQAIVRLERQGRCGWRVVPYRAPRRSAVRTPPGPALYRGPRREEHDMLASCVVDSTNIVAVTYGGPVRADEMLDAREEVDAVVGRHGSARLLVVYAHFAVGRREPRAMWSDLQIARLLEGVDRVAVVADAEWVDDPAGLDPPGHPLDVGGFRVDRCAAALAWLQE